MKNLDDIKFEGKIKGHAGMTMPENFFAEFDKQLEAKLDALEKLQTTTQQPTIGQSKRNWLQYVSVAACAIALVAVGLFVQNLDSNTQAEVEALQLAETENDETSLDEEMLIGTLSDLDLYEYYCNF